MNLSARLSWNLTVTIRLNFSAISSFHLNSTSNLNLLLKIQHSNNFSTIYNFCQNFSSLFFWTTRKNVAKFLPAFEKFRNSIFFQIPSTFTKNFLDLNECEIVHKILKLIRTLNFRALCDFLQSRFAIKKIVTNRKSSKGQFFNFSFFESPIFYMFICEDSVGILRLRCTCFLMDPLGFHWNWPWMVQPCCYQVVFH